MTKEQIGLWLDGKEALLVYSSGGEIVRERLVSDVDSQPRYEGEGSQEGRFGSQFLSGETKRERARDQQEEVYLKKLGKRLAAYSEVLLFGPAEMKLRLARLLESSKSGTISVMVKTSDKLTDNQIAAFVRDHFESERPSP